MSERKRWRGAVVESNAAKTKALADVWLQRCAWCAQILVLGTAIAGYFLTVRPIYQKQLLDEQLAEKSVQLRDSTTAVENSRREQLALQASNESLSKRVERIYEDSKIKLLVDLIDRVPVECSFLTKSEHSAFIYRMKPRFDLTDGFASYLCIEHELKELREHIRENELQRMEATLQNERDVILKLPRVVGLPVNNFGAFAERRNALRKSIVNVAMEGADRGAIEAQRPWLFKSK